MIFLIFANGMSSTLLAAVLAARRATPKAVCTATRQVPEHESIKILCFDAGNGDLDRRPRIGEVL